MEKTKGRLIAEWMTNIKDWTGMRDYNLCDDSCRVFLCVHIGKHSDITYV